MCREVQADRGQSWKAVRVSSSIVETREPGQEADRVVVDPSGVEMELRKRTIGMSSRARSKPGRRFLPS